MSERDRHPEVNDRCVPTELGPVVVPPLQRVADAPNITAAEAPDAIPPIRAPYIGDKIVPPEQPRYSAADRERILGLFAEEEARRLRAPIRNAREEQAQATRFRRAIRQEGAIAASVMIGAVNDPLDRYTVMDHLEVCATEENASEVLRFMALSKALGTWDTWVEPLVSTMQRIATTATIPGLFAYIDAAPALDDKLIRMQQVIKIARAAEARHAEGTVDREHWHAAIAQVIDIRWATGGRMLGPAGLQQAQAKLDMGALALAWAEKTHLAVPDTSLNYLPPDERSKTDLGRLTTLRNLAAIAAKRSGQPQTESAARVLTRQAERERSPSPYAVTLGMEVEIERGALTAGVPDHRAFDVVNARLDTLNYLEGAGLPRYDEESDSVFTEFVPGPANHYATLAYELGQMTALDVVTPDYTEHPWHITVGHTTTRGPKGNAVFVLTRSLEATGWSCSSDRLLRPMYETGTWAHRGDAGLVERMPDKIQGEVPSAVELRTFSVQSLGGAVRTLRSLYALGTALRAHQASEPLDKTQTRLASIWRAFEAAVVPVFAEYGMTSPDPGWKVKEMPRRGGQTLMNGNFLRLAELLHDAKAGGTAGMTFQDRIQQHIIDARAQVMAVLWEQ